MPKTKDPFITQLDPGVKSMSDKYPSSATVIRKGTPYAKRFDERKREVMDYYAKNPDPDATTGIEKRAAGQMAARAVGKGVKQRSYAK